MKSRTLTLGLAASLSVLLAASVHAQQGTTPAPTGTTATQAPATTPPGGTVQRDTTAAQRRGDQLAAEDRDFLENAAQSGHAEIQGSRLAEKSEASAEVQAFAKRMIEDHSRVNAELVALASSKGFELPDDPSVLQRTELTALQALSGEMFDKMYAARIGVAAHENAVELFRKAANEVKDPDIRAFATKHLPALEEHLQMARTLREKVGSD